MIAACITLGGVIIVAVVAFVVLLFKRGGEFNMGWKGPGLSGHLEYKEQGSEKPPRHK